MLGEFGVADQVVKRVDRLLEVAFGTVEITECQAITRGMDLRMAAELLRELLKLRGGERIVLLRVGLASAVEQHLRRLIGGNLGTRVRASQVQNAADQRGEEREADQLLKLVGLKEQGVVSGGVSTRGLGCGFRGMPGGLEPFVRALTVPLAAPIVWLSVAVRDKPPGAPVGKSIVAGNAGRVNRASEEEFDFVEVGNRSLRPAHPVVQLLLPIHRQIAFEHGTVFCSHPPELLPSIAPRRP